MRISEVTEPVQAVTSDDKRLALEKTHSEDLSIEP